MFRNGVIQNGSILGDGIELDLFCVHDILGDNDGFIRRHFLGLCPRQQLENQLHYHRVSMLPNNRRSSSDCVEATDIAAPDRTKEGRTSTG